MDAVTFTSDVCITFIDRFVLKRVTIRVLGEIFSGGVSEPVEGSGAAKPGVEAFLD